MKRYLSLLFVFLFPYFVVFEFVCLIEGDLTETVFQSNPLNFLLALTVMYVAALITSVTVFIVSIVKKWDAKDLLRANLILKIVHIPAYIGIFLIALGCMLTIFTFAISIFPIILACMTILISGLIGLAGVIRSAIEKKICVKEAITHGILQFMFCGDMISSIMIYIRVKKASSDANSQPPAKTSF